MERQLHLDNVIYVLEQRPYKDETLMVGRNAFVALGGEVVDSCQQFNLKSGGFACQCCNESDEKLPSTVEVKDGMVSEFLLDDVVRKSMIVPKKHSWPGDMPSSPSIFEPTSSILFDHLMLALVLPIEKMRNPVQKA